MENVAPQSTQSIFQKFNNWFNTYSDIGINYDPMIAKLITFGKDRKEAIEIAHEIDGYTVIVNKSTVPVGTGDEVENIIRKVAPQGDFDVVSNPEFLREGAAIDDFKRPDRIVVGTNSEPARALMRSLYRSLFINETPIVFTNRRTSELIKYAGNAFLATKITFINEIADLCEKVGANVQEVSKGIGLDGRIGSKFLHAGPGYGGSCFPKDTLALVRTAQEAGAPLSIVNSVISANDARKHKMAAKVVQACGGCVKGKTIAVLGLAFKPNTDDMRESPSVPIIKALLDDGATIRTYDPEAMEEARHQLPDIQYCNDTYECIDTADALLIITEWDQFRALDLDKVKSLMTAPLMVDFRNIYDPVRMAEQGFTYISIGRPQGLIGGIRK